MADRTPTFKEVGKALGDLLSSSVDIDCSIYRGKAGADSTFPHIRMQQQADTDDVEMLGGRVFQYHYIAVIAVSQSASEADELAGILDSVLQRSALTIEFGRHAVTKRIGGIWYQEGDGNTYTHSGGIYRIGVSV